MRCDHCRFHEEVETEDMWEKYHYCILKGRYIKPTGCKLGQEKEHDETSEA